MYANKTKKTASRLAQAHSKTAKKPVVEFNKPVNESFLDLYPGAAVTAATKRARELCGPSTHDGWSRQAFEAARDAFLYGYSFAHEDRAKRAQRLIKEAVDLYNTIDDILEDDDSEVIEVEHDIAHRLSTVMMNLIRAVRDSDAPPFEAEEDEPPLARKRVDMEQLAGQSAALRLKDLMEENLKLRGADTALHVVIEKFIRMALAREDF